MEAKARLLAGVFLAAVLMAVFVLNGTARAEDPIAKTHYRDISGDYAYRFEFYVGRWDIDPWHWWLHPSTSYKVHVGFCPTIPPEDREKIKPYLRQVLAWLQNAQLMRINPIEWDVPASYNDNTLNVYFGGCSQECRDDAKNRDYPAGVTGYNDCLEKPTLQGVNWDKNAWIRVDADNPLPDVRINFTFAEVVDASTGLIRDTDFVEDTWGNTSVFTYACTCAPPEPIDVQMVHWQSKFSKAYVFQHLFYKGIDDLSGHDYNSPDELPSIYRQVFADLWNDNSDWCPSYFSGVWYDASGKPHYVFHVTAVYYDVVNDDSLTPHYYDVVLDCSVNDEFACDVAEAKPLPDQHCTAAFIHVLLDPFDPDVSAYNLSLKLEVPRLAAGSWDPVLKENKYIYAVFGYRKDSGKLILLRWGFVQPYEQ